MELGRDKTLLAAALEREHAVESYEAEERLARRSEIQEL